MKKYNILAGLTMYFIISIFGVSYVFPASGDSGQPGSFLNFGAGARALGMGKAYVGLADDATAVYWNPSCLSKLFGNELIVLHAMMFEDTTYDFISFAYPTLNFGTFGLGATFLRSTGFEGRNISNEVIGNFDETNLAVFLSYGIKLNESIGVGASVKLVSQSVWDYKDNSIGIDVGAFYAPLNFLSVGLMLENVLQPRIKLKSEEDIFPLAAKLGLNIKLADNKINLTVDADSIGANGVKLKGGVEFRPYEYIAIRGGLNETEITGGIGVFYKEFGLSYAIGSQSLGYSSRVSFSWTFGAFDIKVEAEPKVFSPAGTKKEVTIRLLGSSKFELKTWEVNILNTKGEVVRNFNGKGKPAEMIKWDGRSDKGGSAPDGKYDIQFKLVDMMGKTITASDSVNIRTSIQEMNIQMEMR